METLSTNNFIKRFSNKLKHLFIKYNFTDILKNN